MYNNITHQIRGSLAINLATETVLVNDYGLRPHMAKKVVTALDKCGGLKDSDLNSNAKIKKKLGHGIGDKTVKVLDDHKAFKPVFFIVVSFPLPSTALKLNKLECRVPGIYGTLLEAQKAYAKETSSEKKTRKIVNLIPPSKVEKKAKRGKAGVRKVYVGSHHRVTHEKITLGQHFLERRIRQLKDKDLKSVGWGSWVLNPVAPVVLAKPVEAKGKIGISAPTRAYYAGLSNHPSNTGVIGISDMLLNFGPEALSRANRTYWYVTYEPVDLENGKTGVRKVVHHVSDWFHFHAFFENGLHAKAADMVATRSPESIAKKVFDNILFGVDDNFAETVDAVLHAKPSDEDLIPLARIPRGSLRMLHQVQVGDPKARKERLLEAGIEDPKPNEHLKYDGLAEDLAKMASLGGTQIDYSEAEDGFSVDQESIDYSESYLANRRDHSAEQETHNAVNHVSSGNMFDKYSFFEACRAAYESPEYQLFLEFEKIGGGSVIDRSKEIEAVKARKSKLTFEIMETPESEQAELLKERKEVQKKLKELEDGNVNAEGLFNELLGVDDSNKGTTLSYQDARKLYKEMQKEVFGKKWLAEKWLEILDGQEDKSREEAEQEIDSWGMAIFQDSGDTAEIYLSAEIAGDGVLENLLNSDAKREEASADEMMKHQKKEDFFAYTAVVYQQAMGFVQKVIIRDNYEAILTHGVPAREVVVTVTEECLGTPVTGKRSFMTEAIEPVEDFQKRQELLQDKWEELSSVPQKKSEGSSEE